MLIKTATASLNSHWENPLNEIQSFDNKDHLVQFYENEKFLCDVVTSYASTSLKKNHGVIIIATQAHRQCIEHELTLQKINVKQVKAKGQLVMLDATETLSLFMQAGMPHAKTFNTVIGYLVEKVIQQYGKVLAYGEMVNLLWEEGNIQATLELERLWNKLASTHSFTLLCGYDINNFKDELHSNAFYEICHQHSHVIPTDNFTQLQKPDEQNQMIAMLQQRAKALETEIARRKINEEKLQQALKIRDEFISVASHELKTPITNLSLQVHNLKRISSQGGTNETYEKIKKGIASFDMSTKKLTHIIDQLFDLARIRSGKLKLERNKVDLVEIINEVVASFMHESLLLGKASFFSESITVNAPASLVGSWDKLRIEQVITNLLSNAIKYGDGNPIEIKAYVNSLASTAILTIKDQGIGISSENQARIFEQFERANSTTNFGGLGLGLYIAKQIVDAHKGNISINSQLHQGSTFTVELPLANTE